MAENGGVVDDTQPLENGLPEVLAEEDEEEHFGQIEVSCHAVYASSAGS